ncbi:unnamed protein product [Closterium sp. NIES-65]|nr:unnamed protein product [Closterium sp. NIES-65]
MGAGETGEAGGGGRAGVERRGEPREGEAGGESHVACKAIPHGGHVGLQAGIEAAWQVRPHDDMCGAAQSIHHAPCSRHCSIPCPIPCLLTYQFVPSLAPVAPPCACRGRGSRAVVEAVGRAAVLHDASYHSAIQLTGAQADISALLACCTSPGALPLASRPAPATPHTAHAARTDRGDGGAGEAARGEAWRRGVLELRALLCSVSSDTSSSDVIGPASFMWQAVACAAEQGCDGAARAPRATARAPGATAVLGAASGQGGGGERGGGEVKGGQKDEGFGWKQRRREKQGRRKQEQRRQRCVWVWVHALMLPDALAALTAASQQLDQESSSEQKGWRRRRVSVESREGELCRLEVAGRAALPLLLSVLRPSAPFNTLSPVLLPLPFPAAAAPAASASPAAPTSASPAGRSASSAAASARLQQSEASWKVLAEQGAHLPGGAVVGLRAVDARLLAGRGREAGGVAGGAPGGRIGSSHGQHTGSADVLHKGGLCFDWWRDVAGSVDGASIAAAPTLWIPREQHRAARCRGEHGARRGGGNESHMEMHDAWEAEEEARLTMGDSGEERAETREGVGGQRGGEVRGTAAAVTSTTPLPLSAPPPQRLLDAWRRALKLQGLMGAREAQRMGESVAGQWVQWQAGRGEGGSGGEGRGGGDGACGGEVCGEQAGCDVVVVKHGCGAMQGAAVTRCGVAVTRCGVAVTRWSVIVPSEWLQVCWYPFILHGAHAIGLAERHTLFTAAGLPLFPYDYSETFGYRCHVAASYLLQRARYDRTPPSKRPLCPPLPPAWAAASGAWGGAGEGGERGRDGGEGREGGGGEAEADMDLRVARCSARALSALLPAALRHGSRAAAHGDAADGEGGGGRGLWVDGRVTDQGGKGHAGQAGSGGGGWKLGAVGGAHGSRVGGAHGSRVGGAHGSRVSVEWRRVGERERGSTTWEERGADAAGGACVADGHGGGSVGMAMDVDSPAACPPLPLHALSSTAAPPRQHEQQGTCMVAVRVVPAGRGAAQAAAELCVPSPQDFHRFCFRRNGASVHGVHSPRASPLRLGPTLALALPLQLPPLPVYPGSVRASAWRGVVLPPSLLRTRLGSVPVAMARKTKRQVQKQKQRERRRGTEEEQYVASLRETEGLQRKEGDGARGGGQWCGGTRRGIREVVGFVTSAAPRGSKSRVSLGCVRASALHAAACRQYSSTIPSLSTIPSISTTSPSAALLPSVRVLLLMRCPASSAFRPVLVSLAAEDSGHLASTGWS